MDTIKKYWYVGLLIVGTISLGTTSFIISNRLQQPESVANVAPRAATPECSISFTISNPPTATPVPATCDQSCTAFTNCGAGLTCSDGRCRATACTNVSSCVCPTNTPTSTPVPTKTPAPGACNSQCSPTNPCTGNLVCTQGLCRNRECTEQANCACYFVPTPKVPVTGTGTTLLGIGVIAGGIILLLLGLAF